MVPDRTLSWQALMVFFAVQLFLAGCGREERIQSPQADLEYRPPVYAILPDDAPLRDQMEEAAGYIERQLLEEQQKVNLQREDEVRTFYTAPDGSRLLSKDSWKQVEPFLDSKAPARLSIRILAFELRAPAAAAPPGTVLGTPETAPVYLLGDTVQGSAYFTDQVPLHTIRMRTVYHYRFEPSDDSPAPGEYRIGRDIGFTKTESGNWERTAIQEFPAPVTAPSP
jgi:hypothetical protein